MTIKEAIYERHMVRQYNDKPIPEEIVELLNARIAKNNNEHKLNLALVTGNADGVSRMAKVLLSKTVNNYIILAGAEGEGLDERLGFSGADLILYAQTLGLNTWWIGGMFNAKGAKNHLKVDGTKIKGVIAVGYGKTQGIQHKSKTAAEVSYYNGEAPEWFAAGVEALLHAPTALNKQAFMVKGDGRRVSIDCGGGHFAGVDLGIGKYHFEVGAGKENFEWV